MIRTVLIANRGEIACRIMRTCRKMGIRTVAVYSDADADALHVGMADEAVHVGGAPAGESYLVIEKIIQAAQRTGADAIHPGFGFLAENADFARACEEAGLIFIGPSADAIEAMGNKRAAKALVRGHDVPILPGYGDVDQSDERMTAEAGRIGYPVMVKAAAGGGGKGMRLVMSAHELTSALESARREASQAFGSDELILEKALINPRHIEIQVLGDAHGHLIHLGERECSIQRRHQKIIEEAPSPVINPELREAMGQAAVNAAKAVDYVSAGTVEFLLDEDGAFYFMEMNTRLQVEHPVTEMITGVDLAAWQIRIADGEPLTLMQEDVRFDGHAIEVRVYAENPANDFLPVTGDVVRWSASEAEDVRVESGLKARDTVTQYYDPMLAKIIAHGPDRMTAIRRLIYALDDTVLFGLVNNLAFLRDVLNHPAFIAGELSTAFVDVHFGDWTPEIATAGEAFIACALLESSYSQSGDGYWRNNPNMPERFKYAIDGDVIAVDVRPIRFGAGVGVGGQFEVALNGETADVTLNALSENTITVTVNGLRRTLTYAQDGDCWWIKMNGDVVMLESIPLLPEPKPVAGAGGSLRAPMPGSVIAVLVEVGQTVKKGDALMKLEAMKMEHTIRTEADGVVEAIYYGLGDTVKADDQLLQITSEAMA